MTHAEERRRDDLREAAIDANPRPMWTHCDIELPELNQPVQAVSIAPNGHRTILGQVMLVRHPDGRGGIWVYAHAVRPVEGDRQPTHWRGV